MKKLIAALLVLAMYGCVAAAVVIYGVKAGALVFLALVIMGVLEGIV